MCARVPLYNLYRHNGSGHSNEPLENFFSFEAKSTVSEMFLNISPNFSVRLPVSLLNVSTEMHLRWRFWPGDALRWRHLLTLSIRFMFLICGPLVLLAFYLLSDWLQLSCGPCTNQDPFHWVASKFLTYFLNRSVFSIFSLSYTTHVANLVKDK